MVNKQFFCFIIALCLFSGCGRQQLAPEQFMAYYNNNKQELEKTRDSEAFSFEAGYLPGEVLALRENNHAASADGRAFDNALRNYDSAYYFAFKITPLNNVPMKKLVATKEKYAQMLHYLNGEIKNDFYLEAGAKKINCGLMHVESELSIQNSFLFVMSFEKTDFADALKEDLVLVYNDELFQHGILKFRFSKSDINHFPKIKAS